MWREIGWRAEPGRNTGPDLHHLLYVVDGAVVVTTDEAMAKLVSSSGGSVADTSVLED